jgi:hypothetical protein
MASLTHYLTLLLDITDVVAIDTHLRGFVWAAGITTASDAEAGMVVAMAAHLLKVTPGDLDTSIWRHRAGRSGYGPHMRSPRSTACGRCLRRYHAYRL